MANCGVYALVFQTPSGEKSYIGSTVQPFKKRLNYHLCELRLSRHPNIHLQRLWNNYGMPEFRVLEVCSNLTEKEIRDREQAWIDNANPSELVNIGPATPSAAFGLKLTAEARAKIGEASRLHWKNPDYRKRRAESNSIAFKGRKFSKEHKEALSKAHKGIPLSSAHKASLAAALRSPEVREKISNTLKGRKLSNERKAAISKALRAPDVLKRISSKGRIASRETRAKLSNILKGNQRRKGTISSEETRAKISAGVKQAWVKKKQGCANVG